jgi:tetratricopeptide (TPR) repeat protein
LSQASGDSNAGFHGGFYTEEVKRIGLLAILAAYSLWSQDKREEAKKSEPAPAQQEQEPPEEDESLKPTEYSFNPLKAESDLKIGNFYFKKGNYKAAASRFQDATRWNPTYAEAFRRLGDAREKLKDSVAAREAFEKYLDLEPKGKEAEAIKKKLSGKR